MLPFHQISFTYGSFFKIESFSYFEDILAFCFQLIFHSKQNHFKPQPYEVLETDLNQSCSCNENKRLCSKHLWNCTQHKYFSQIFTHFCPAWIGADGHYLTVKRVFHFLAQNGSNWGSVLNCQFKQMKK
jgi:hypothetical protein